MDGFELLSQMEVERRPSATLNDLRGRLLGEHGVSVSVGMTWKVLRPEMAG